MFISSRMFRINLPFVSNTAGSVGNQFFSRCYLHIVMCDLAKYRKYAIVSLTALHSQNERSIDLRCVNRFEAKEDEE